MKKKKDRKKQLRAVEEIIKDVYKRCDYAEIYPVKNFQELKEQIDKEIQDIENKKTINIQKKEDGYYVSAVSYK